MKRYYNTKEAQSEYNTVEKEKSCYSVNACRTGKYIGGYS